MNDRAKRVCEELCGKGMKPWSALTPHGRARAISRIIPGGPQQDDWSTMRDNIVRRAEERAAQANRLLAQVKNHLSSAERYASLVVKFPDHPTVKYKYRDKLDNKVLELSQTMQELYKGGLMGDTMQVRALDTKRGNALVVPMKNSSKSSASAMQVYRDLSGISAELESSGGTLLVPTRTMPECDYYVPDTPYSMFIDYKSVYCIEPEHVVESDIHTDLGEIDLRLALDGYILKMSLNGGVTNTTKCVPLTDTVCTHGYPYGHIRNTEGTLCMSEAAAPAAMGAGLNMFSLVRAAILPIIHEPKGGLQDGYSISACAEAEYLCRKCGGWHKIGNLAGNMRANMPCELSLVECQCCHGKYDPDNIQDAVKSTDGSTMHRKCVEVCPYTDLACTKDQIIHDELCPALPPLHPASPMVRCSYTGIRCIPLQLGRGWMTLKSRLVRAGVMSRLAIQMADGSWCWTGFLPSMPGWADKVSDQSKAHRSLGTVGVNLLHCESQDFYAERMRSLFNFGVERKGEMATSTLCGDGVISLDMRLARFPFRSVNTITGSMWIFTTEKFTRTMCVVQRGEYKPDLVMPDNIRQKFYEFGYLRTDPARDPALPYPAMCIAVADVPVSTPVAVEVVNLNAMEARVPDTVWHPDDDEEFVDDDADLDTDGDDDLDHDDDDDHDDEENT